MPHRKQYTAQFRREDGWWIVRIAEAQGVHSNGRTLDEARRRVREALSLDIGDDAFAVDILDEIALPGRHAGSYPDTVRLSGAHRRSKPRQWRRPARPSARSTTQA